MSDDLKRFAEEIKRHFDTVSEGTRHEIRLVAEAVATLDAKLDRGLSEVRAEMHTGFDETQAMIKFSYAELDRRLTTVEHETADLRARVERLEGKGAS